MGACVKNIHHNSCGCLTVSHAEAVVSYSYMGNYSVINLVIVTSKFHYQTEHGLEYEMKFTAITIASYVCMAMTRDAYMLSICHGKSWIV